MMTLTSLFGTLGVKAVLEALEILGLPETYAWMPWVIVPTVLVGIAVAATYGMPLLRKEMVTRVGFVRWEKVSIAFLVAMILGFQLFPFFPGSL